MTTKPQTVFDTPIFNALVRGGLSDNEALVFAQKALKRRGNGSAGYWRTCTTLVIMAELGCSATEAAVFSSALTQTATRHDANAATTILPIKETIKLTNKLT